MKVLHTDEKEPEIFDKPEEVKTKDTDNRSLWIIGMLVLIAAVTIAIMWYNSKDKDNGTK